MRAIIGACVCAGALAFAAGPALADASHPDFPDSTLSLTIAPPTSSSFTFTLNAAGSNAEVDDFGDQVDYDLILFVVDPTVQPACEASEDDELQDSIDDPDDVGLVNLDGEPTFDEGVSGSFSAPVSLQIPSTFSGPLMFCGYSLWDDFEDAASATVSTTVTSTGGTPPPTTPAPVPLPTPPPTTPTLPSTPPQKKLPLKRVKGKLPKALIPKRNRLMKPRLVAVPEVVPAGKNELACFTGTWLQLPTNYQYKWLMPHRRGALGHKDALKVTSSLRGKKVECSVTVSNRAGQAHAVSPAYKIK